MLVFANDDMIMRVGAPGRALAGVCSSAQRSERSARASCMRMTRCSMRGILFAWSGLGDP